MSVILIRLRPLIPRTGSVLPGLGMVTFGLPFAVSQTLAIRDLPVASGQGGYKALIDSGHGGLMNPIAGSLPCRFAAAEAGLHRHKGVGTSVFREREQTFRVFQRRVPCVRFRHEKHSIVTGQCGSRCHLEISVFVPGEYAAFRQPAFPLPRTVVLVLFVPSRLG